jgi:hypothetical protein
VATSHCKRVSVRGRIRRTGWRRSVLPACAVTLGALAACSIQPAQERLTIHSLEMAQKVCPEAPRRAIVSDCAALQDLCYPLAGRLGLLQVHSPDDWSRLIQVAPELGPCPDFSRGMVVGVVSWAGLPLDGEWPIALEDVRCCHGAGLVSAHFRGGSYLPDGTTYLEAAFLEDLEAVLILDVNGVRFYPH